MEWDILSTFVPDPECLWCLALFCRLIEVVEVSTTSSQASCSDMVVMSAESVAPQSLKPILKSLCIACRWIRWISLLKHILYGRKTGFPCLKLRESSMKFGRAVVAALIHPGNTASKVWNCILAQWWWLLRVCEALNSNFYQWFHWQPGESSRNTHFCKSFSGSIVLADRLLKEEGGLQAQSHLWCWNLLHGQCTCHRNNQCQKIQHQSFNSHQAIYPNGEK